MVCIMERYYGKYIGVALPTLFFYCETKCGQVIVEDLNARILNVSVCMDGKDSDFEMKHHCHTNVNVLPVTVPGPIERTLYGVCMPTRSY